MSVPVKLAAFLAGLVACFGIGLGIGAAVGPVDSTGTPSHTTPSPEAPTATTMPAGMGH